MLRTGELIAVREVRLIAKKALVVLVIAIGFPGSLMLMASAANAQEARTAASMAALKDKTAKLGAPKIQGMEEVGGKSAPVLYFGSTKMNNNFTVVDEVAKEGGPGMVATLFVKAGVQQTVRPPAKNISALRLACCSLTVGERLELLWGHRRSSR